MGAAQLCGAEVAGLLTGTWAQGAGHSSSNPTGHPEIHASKRCVFMNEKTRYFCLVEIVENFRKEKNPVFFFFF